MIIQSIEILTLNVKCFSLAVIVNLRICYTLVIMRHLLLHSTFIARHDQPVFRSSKIQLLLIRVHAIYAPTAFHATRYVRAHEHFPTQTNSKVGNVLMYFVFVTKFSSYIDFNIFCFRCFKIILSFRKFSESGPQ